MAKHPTDLKAQVKWKQRCKQISRKIDQERRRAKKREPIAPANQ